METDSRKLEAGVPVSQRRASLVRRLRRRKTRERERSVLVEGVRAVAEAIAAGVEVRFAVASPRLDANPDGLRLQERLSAAGVVPDRVEDQDLESLADTEHPQGILLVCTQPVEPEGTLSSAGRYLVLDGVQDPGNAGTLVRAATAFGLDGVIALDGTVDLWGAKAVRASAGMAFRIPIRTMTMEALAAASSAAAVRILVADPRGIDIARADRHPGWVLVTGNEGVGPRDEIARLAADRVAVPMPGPAESLNVGMAGAVLLYALTREIDLD